MDNRKDPDRVGKDLYDDLKDLFFKDTSMKAENREQRDRYQEGSFFYTIFINNNEFRLSSDYIGPSIYWSKELGIKDNEIINYLKIARTLGGHILWPRGNGKTINQARAGNSGFYDRIDWTLLAVDAFYKTIISNKKDKADFILECKKLLPKEVCNYKQYEDKFKSIYDSLKNYKSWLEIFGTLVTFVISLN